MRALTVGANVKNTSVLFCGLADVPGTGCAAEAEAPMATDFDA